MKKNVLFIASIVATLVLSACSNDDDNTPEEVNEEEVITTLILTLTPEGGGPTVTFQSQDLDGDGPGAPVLTVTGQLEANTTYTSTIGFLNETEDPAENITLEVIEEADEHQVFYIAGGALNLTSTYLDGDGDGNPLGVLMGFETGDASLGNLTVVLRHEPNKPNDGTLADAGGETDIEAVFTGVSIQ
ncbi:type 1 periplasmic binding fold superfamily protein [Gilvibacter sediminis]|uniref:type 1 periplasmic binding fold superfamily protein n=1 Tax=Gilvibacter sediminis TaxID=379071 RepID=UPI002350F63C|nr:type 1 periplasmic binding fold superfamily protein [Gilvibacter sediminis]MDC7998238.1 type 1 periplasmic binding fold superfamily protein [Gilvibacter sediminis]